MILDETFLLTTEIQVLNPTAQMSRKHTNVCVIRILRTFELIDNILAWSQGVAQFRLEIRTNFKQFISKIDFNIQYGS